MPGLGHQVGQDPGLTNLLSHNSVIEFDGLQILQGIAGKALAADSPSAKIRPSTSPVAGHKFIRIMSTFRRLLLITVLVTYVAGLAVLAATSSSMAGNMVMGGAGEMGDCQGCDPAGGEDPALACDTPCLTPLMATLTPDAALWVPRSEQAVGAAGSSFASRTGSPDPSPPRSIFLR